VHGKIQTRRLAAVDPILDPVSVPMVTLSPQPILNNKRELKAPFPRALNDLPLKDRDRKPELSISPDNATIER
jgi:hypothetical protein